MAQDKRVLIELVNMLSGTLQDIGQQRQQAGAQRAQMEMQAKDLKMRADYNKAMLSDRKAQRDLEALDREMQADALAGSASTATGFAQPGGVEGLKSTGVETQWEQIHAAMTPEQQQNPSYISGAFKSLGGAEAMREELPTAAEIAADADAYAFLARGNPDILGTLPEYMQPYSGNIEYIVGEYEAGKRKEEQQWDLGMSEMAFNQGMMAGFNEDIGIGEMEYPATLDPGYEQFFQAGARSTREKLKQGRYRGGGGGGGGYMSQYSALDDAILHGQVPTDEQFETAGVRDKDAYIKAVQSGGMFKGPDDGGTNEGAFLAELQSNYMSGVGAGTLSWNELSQRRDELRAHQNDALKTSEYLYLNITDMLKQIQGELTLLEQQEDSETNIVESLTGKNPLYGG